MEEGGRGVKDELFDLNEEPIERKRKRVENSSIDNGEVGSDALPKVVKRVLRSMTTAVAEGEKQVTNMEIDTIEDKDEIEASVSHEREKRKGRRGWPTKMQGKHGVNSLNHGKTKDEVVKLEKFDESTKGTGRGRKKVKRGRGRPPTMENGNKGVAVKMRKFKGKNDKGTFSYSYKKTDYHPKKAGSWSGTKKLNADPDGSENRFMRREKVKKKYVEGQEMGRREQQQLVRDQIVAMLKKAGWTIEYRQRQKRDYMDAVYVDREGRTHWSVTLAYKKLKDKIDGGRADAKDISAFSPIPEETLSALFRITEKGKKAGKAKKAASKAIERITKKVSFESKSSDRRISRSTQGKGRKLLARRPGEGSDGGDYELYEGKRSLLSWMIDLGSIPLGGNVMYERGRNRKILLKGRITKYGICCDCCDKMHTIQDFESHAGRKTGNPYCNIYLDSGISLSQCLKDSWRKHLETDNVGFVYVDIDGNDPNDDTCNICGDGGDLICCDSCPSTFHHGCLCVNVPSGNWHCVYCSCKFCGIAGENASTTDDNQNYFASELFACLLCEEKFHVQCTEGMIAENFDYGDQPSFCSMECLRIFEHLQVLGIRYEIEEGFSYTILQRRDSSLNDDLAHEEINSKLAVAFTVMDECFEPIIDERSGCNVIQNVVYNCGSNIRRLNFGGFYTIVLEKGDEHVAAASIRIHGSQVAEMPFIGTRYVYRRQGMCRRLLTAIETVLCSLGVKKLVIPAISILNETWTKVFGFVPLEESERQEMKYANFIAFPGIDTLQKPVLRHPFNGGEQTDNAEVELCFDVPDNSATKSIEVETPRQNSQAQNEDSSGPTRSKFDTYDIKILDHNEAGATKSGAVEAGVAESSAIEAGAAESGADESGAELPVGSLNEATDVQNGRLCVSESSGHENCLNDLGSKGSNSFLKDGSSADCKLEAKQSGSADCKLEAKQSAEQINTRQNGFALPLITGKL